MAVGDIRAWHCTKWERGMDCSFNEWLHHFCWAIIWAVTVLVFLRKVWTWREDAPKGASRQCLLLVATSASLQSLDEILFLAFGVREKEADEYGQQTLSSLGTIFLMFALRLFARIWCDVAKALGSWTLPGAQASSGRRDILWCVIRTGYTGIAIIHIPFAILMSISDYKWGPEFDQVIIVWAGWCFVSLFLVYSILAVVMWCWVSKYVPSSNITNLRLVTLINLLEQIAYDIILVIAAALYFTDAYNFYGLVQAAVQNMLSILSWLLHVQVLIFFLICKPTDPLCSDEMLASLVEMNTWDQVDDQAETLGLPTPSLPT